LLKLFGLEFKCQVVRYSYILTSVAWMGTPALEAPLVPVEGQHPWEGWREYLSVNILGYVFDLKDNESVENMRRYRTSFLTSFHVAGPIYTLIWPVTLVLWSMALVVPILAFLFSPCPDESEPFAHYPWWVWLPFAFAWLFAMRREWQALKMMFLPYVQRCGPMMLLGFKFDNCGHYLLIVGILSGLAKVDLANNGLFTSKIWMTRHCPSSTSSKEVVKLWQEVIQHSVVGWVPKVDDITFLFTVVWELMFFQFFWCLSSGLPWRWNDTPIEYGWASMENGYHTPGSFIRGLWKRDPNSSKQWHADLLRVIALGNRMQVLVDRNMAWTLARAEDKWAIEDDEEHCHDIIKKETARTRQRLWLFTILERAVVLECQVSLFAISRCLFIMHTHHPWYLRYDGQMLLSIGVAFVTFTKALFDSIDQRKQIREIVKKVRNERYDYRTVEFRICNITVGIVAGIMFLLHCFIKLVASFTCKNAFWNIPLFDKCVGLSGCVDMTCAFGNMGNSSVSQ